MGNLKLSIVIEFVHKLNIESCSNGQAWLLVAINGRICEFMYEGWNFNSGNYLFAADTK